MAQINHLDELSKSKLFDDIDRVINVLKIEEMQELKKLVRFVDHLIQSLIHQIMSGLLSDKGAKLKILQCINIIQHCQVLNHPSIKSQLDKLKRTFENTYKQQLDKDLTLIKPKSIVLASATIQAYIENIKDSQNDPIYSEAPKSLIDATNLQMKNKAYESKSNNKTQSKKQLDAYYLSTLYFSSKNKEKIMHYASQNLKTTNTTKKDRMRQFESLSQSYNRKITETA